MSFFFLALNELLWTIIYAIILTGMLTFPLDVAHYTMRKSVGRKKLRWNGMFSFLKNCKPAEEPRQNLMFWSGIQCGLHIYGAKWSTSSVSVYHATWIYRKGIVLKQGRSRRNNNSDWQSSFSPMGAKPGRVKVELGLSGLLLSSSFPCKSIKTEDY